MAMIKFIELFAGIGGFRYGLGCCPENQGQGVQGIRNQREGNSEQLDIGSNGFACVYANEWDKYAAQIYRRHYGEIDERDITTVDVSETPDHDLLTAGFPCQAFSVAGKRLGFEDTRGTLFFEIARILKSKRPGHFLLENVKGLLSHEEGKTFQTILGILSDLGYRCEWMVLNSKHFGVPQNRERVFVIGHLGGECGGKVFPVNGTHNQTLRYYQGDVSGKGYSSQQDRVYLEHGLMATLPSTRTENKTNIAVNVQNGELKIRQDESCLDANYFKGIDNHQARTGVLEGTRIRRLTPIECERLQGFPDGWTEGVSDTQRYKCLGNAVTTNVITAIGEKLLEHIMENEHET